ncbi:MAG: hypothetical protein Q9163_005967 [Psora crenata]
MRDLRKQALLESGKTMSRKARSRQSTPASSRLNTPASSRAASRTRGANSRGGSDEEGDGDQSDETSFSVGSIDEILNGDGAEPATDAWRAELADRIQEIFARKGSTIQGREKCYKTYAHLLMAQYAEEEIRGKEDELIAALLKSIKEERSELETVLATKALAITLITSPSDAIFETAVAPLRRAITHSELISTKTSAIHALGICTFYGGASENEILETMDYFLEIITSDGHTISASDEPKPVVAALEEWGFLCTLVDDMSAQSEDAVEAFAEQLLSSYAAVQIAAGENIALLYEKSFKALDIEGGDSPGDYPSSDILSDPDETPGVPKLIRIYPAYRRTDKLLHTLTSLSRNNNSSVHHISKTDRKALKTNFSEIANSVSFPHRGPKYSNAIDDESGKRYGSRMTVRIHKDGVMRIDRWWKLTRLQGLRRILQGGFVGHYENNEVVFDTLPIMITNDRNGA